MNLEESNLWLIYGLWALLLGSGLAAAAWLVGSAVVRARHHGLRLLGAAAVLGVTMAVAVVWIQAPTTSGTSCTMDTLSMALASGSSDVPADDYCVRNGRLRIGASGAVELGVLLGCLRLNRKRAVASEVSART